MTALTPILAELLDRATSEPYGLVITTNNPKQLQVQFANLQRELGSRRHHSIIACIPSTPDTVCLTKRSVELPL
jgi:hypothetical protein